MSLAGAGLALPAQAQDVSAGKAAYDKQCSRCHGITGRGDGVDAKRFHPRPRDLTSGVYKFRSTVSGTPPTDEDLMRTLAHGLPGTNMPDWPHLNVTEREHVVAYLKTLSPIFADTQPQPVPTAPDPGARADLAKGKAVYEQLGCAACHGASGRANGMSAAGLVDDWGMPLRPADLTQGWSYRGGAEPKQIMLRLLAGIDGAGMPSYAEAVSAEDAWHLAYYVASLQEPANWNMIAHPARIGGALPTAWDDPRWNGLERTDVRLRHAVEPDGTWARPATVRAAAFQAVHNGQGVAFRIWWNDPSEERQRPADRMALLMKPSGSQGDVVSLQAWPYAGAPKLDVTLWSADSGQARAAVSESYDSAFLGTETPLTSSAEYRDGRWQLILHRPRQAAGLAPVIEGLTPIAFAVWDGADPDSRAVSPWVELNIHSEGGHH